MSTQLRPLENSKNPIKALRRGFRSGQENTLQQLQIPSPEENASLLRDVRECLEVLDLRMVEQGKNFSTRLNDLLSRHDHSRREMERAIESVETHLQKFHESFIKHKQESVTSRREFRDKIASLFQNEAVSLEKVEARFNEKLERVGNSIRNSSSALESRLDNVEKSLSSARNESSSVTVPHLSLVDEHNIQDFLRQEASPQESVERTRLHQNLFFGLVIFLQLTVAAMLLWQQAHSPHF